MSEACYAEGCISPAEHELHGEKMCTVHYIEALEHGAHIAVSQEQHVGAIRLSEMHKTMVLARLNERMIRRKIQKQKKEQEFGRSIGNEPMNPRGIAEPEAPRDGD